MNTETAEKEEFKFDRRKHVIYDYTLSPDGRLEANVTLHPDAIAAAQLREMQRPVLSEEEKEAINSETAILKQAREAINHALDYASQTFHWCKKMPYVADEATGDLSFVKWRGSEADWTETLAPILERAKLIEESKVSEGSELYLVTSPDLKDVLELLKDFREEVAQTTPSAIGQVGFYQGVRVMVDPYFPPNYFLFAVGDLTIPNAVSINSNSGTLVKVLGMCS